MSGIYITNKCFSEEDIEKKLKTISFRGPDNLYVEKKENILLGQVSLATLDLDKRSNQPYSYKHLHLVYDGSIYNFLSIREELISFGYIFETESDAEVLIKGYAEWGEAVLDRLNGDFAFVIYDQIKKEIFCAKDRLGVKPFYYYWKEGLFEICSQLRPLFQKDLQISNDAVAIYLDSGYVPSPFTIFEDVYKLQSGHILKIDLVNKTKETYAYWDLKEIQEKEITYEQAKEELHQLLIDAVKVRMSSEVPFGAFLSGGIDSALVSAIAAKYSDKPIRTFTIAFDDPKYDESKIAKQYAEIIGSNHIETTCSPEQFLELIVELQKVYDEPFADSSALPSLLLNKITKQHVSVALSGDGGDEGFLGYLHFNWVKKFKKIDWIPYPIRKGISHFPFYKIIKSRPETIRGFLSTKDENEMIANIFMTFDTQCIHRDFDWLDKYYPQFKNLSKDSLQKAADLNIKLWLENDSNVKVDRASMASSVEVRSPFLDYRVIEFARNLPIEYRLKEGITKRIIRDILAEYIPREVFTQPKKGFAIPIGKWIREDLREHILEKLNEDFLQTIPNLDIEKFKNKLKMHLENQYDYSFAIWKVYVFALWKEEFLKSIDNS